MQEGVGTPDVLLPAGASPHHYSLRPSDLRRVKEADLVYWIGPDLESFLPKVLAGRERKSVAVQDMQGLHLRHFGEEHHHDDEPLEFQPEKHEGHDEKEPATKLQVDNHDQLHSPGALDAHLWLRPENARVIAERMVVDLALVDPSNADRYQANLAAFEQRLKTLDIKLKTRLEPLAGKPFFVFHQAFDYFEEAYGLQHAGVFAVSAEVQPGARHVAEMRERLKAAGPACVFSEPPMRPRLAQTLSDGLPVHFAELDALGFGLKPAYNGYEQLLTSLSEGLAGCLEQL
ncbi:High-affinity zinc uptake system protein ZnuA precursor [compost metagenome]